MARTLMSKTFQYGGDAAEVRDRFRSAGVTLLFTAEESQAFLDRAVERMAAAAAAGIDPMAPTAVRP